MGRSVDAFDSIHAQHGETAAELCQFIPAQDQVGFGAACHNGILADSLFVRYSTSVLHLPCSDHPENSFIGPERPGAVPQGPQRSRET